MSHFAVLVITDEQPTNAVLTKALQPFHEYECTGIDDQYVVDVDVTDKVNEAWEAPTKVVRLADGSIFSRYDQRFYHPTGKIEYGREETAFRLPEGAIETEVPLKDSGEYESIEAYAEEYGNWKRHADGKFYDHTNPNSKWDWWVLGGRYNGRLYSKGNALTAKGRGGLMTPLSTEGHDSVRRDDLDFDAMKKAKQAERREWANEVRSKSGLPDADIERGIQLNNQFNEQWKDLPDPKPRGKEFHDWIKTHGLDGEIVVKIREAAWDLPPLKGAQTLEQWIEAAPAISSWTVLKDGEWTEKGSMGWFGVSTGDKDELEWERTVSELVENLRPDQWLSVVDCHI